MVLESNSSKVERRADPNSVDDTGINASNFGGLNTVASALSIPFEDSPNLTNCQITVSGTIQKRKGTRVTANLPGASTGVSTAVVTTGLGFNYQVVKNGGNIAIYETTNNVSYQLMEKLNVFGARATNVKVATTQTNEFEPRLIMCSGTNPPVQLVFVEQQVSQNGASSVTVTLSNAERYKHANTTNLIVYQDGARFNSITNVTYDAANKTLTVTVPTPYTGFKLFTFVLITWQWMAEAYRFKGEHFWKAGTRYHSVLTDQNVAIPESVRDNMDFLGGAYADSYPVRLSTITNFAPPSGMGGAEYSTNKEPNNDYRWAFGDGSKYTYSAGNKLNPSPLFVTFGHTIGGSSTTTSATQGPTPLYFERVRAVNFNGGIGASPSEWRVLVNGALMTQSTTYASATGAFGSYHLYSPSLNFVTDTVTPAKYLRFEASQTMGLGNNDKVEVINSAPHHMGGGANSNLDPYRDGSLVPIYGLGDTSDYFQGFHPRSCYVFQGRLIFGGWPHQPMQLLMSNIYDTTIPGVNFNDYQIYQSPWPLTDVSAIDIQISNTSDDRIVNMVEFQNNLFIFTRRAVFRLSGVEGQVTPNGVSVAYVANYGIVNAQCLARVDNTVLFLSDTGIYDITPTVESGDYRASERSLKIRNRIINTSFSGVKEALPWMSYDSTQRELYVAIPDGLTDTAAYLYVYNTVREAWMEYTTPGRFQTFGAHQYQDRTTGTSFALVCCTNRLNDLPNNFVLLKMNDSKYLDFATYYTSTGVQSDYAIPPIQRTTITTMDGIQEYTMPLQYIPLGNVEDLVVTLNGVRLTFGVDWIKRPQGTMYLFANPGNKTMVISLRRPETNYFVGNFEYGGDYDLQHSIVYVDNILKKEIVDYSVVETSGISYVRLTAPANAVVCAGQAYPCIYTTPLFTRQSLMEYKRLKHFYGYFDNFAAGNAYLHTDINSASGQVVAELAGQPKVRVDANISFIYNNDLSGETTADIYGFNEVVWEDSTFDVDPSALAYEKAVLIKEAIQGIGYGFQVMVWSFDDSAFSLVGYQIDASKKGKRYQTWSN